MVVGSVAIDLACDYKPMDDTSEDPVLGTSNPASIGQSIGGVGHNVATAAHLLHGDKVQLASVIADDLYVCAFILVFVTFVIICAH